MRLFIEEQLNPWLSNREQGMVLICMIRINLRLGIKPDVKVLPGGLFRVGFDRHKDLWRFACQWERLKAFEGGLPPRA